MKVELSVFERMLIIGVFSEFNSSMRFQKAEDKKAIISLLEITEEEKEKIDYVVKEGAVNQVKFDIPKAEEIIKEYTIAGWTLDLIQTWLHYSELLDDIKSSHCSLYSKFCLKQKKE